MAESTVKDQLIALLKAGAEEQRAFITWLSDTQRLQAGTPDKWSAKDNLAHVAYWQAHQVEEFRLHEHGQTPPKLPRDNEQNQLIFQEHHHKSWPEVIAAAETSYAALLALAESYSETDLTTLNPLPPPRDNSLWRYFLSNGYSHPIAHYADFFLWSTAI